LNHCDHGNPKNEEKYQADNKSGENKLREDELEIISQKYKLRENKPRDDK
jgi:hypothetical protein